MCCTTLHKFDALWGIVQAAIPVEESLTKDGAVRRDVAISAAFGLDRPFRCSLPPLQPKANAVALAFVLKLSERQLHRRS